MSEATQILLTVVLVVCLCAAGWLLLGRSGGVVGARLRSRRPRPDARFAAVVRATAAVPVVVRPVVAACVPGDGDLAGGPGQERDAAARRPSGAGVPIRRNTSAATRIARLGGYRTPPHVAGTAAGRRERPGTHAA